jgi:hypothetical protein
MTRAWLAATALLLLTAWPAAAQRRVELGIGGGLAGGASLGTLDATLTSNNTAGSPFRLFSSDTRLAPAAVIEGRIGYRATPRLTIEGILTVGTPELRTSLTGDVENAANVEATEAVTEYVVTAGASWRLWTNPRRRWVPFVSGGAGVARHVHAGPSLIESGVDGYVGGGLVHEMSRRTGLRVDGRLHLLSGGLAEGSDVSTRGTITGSIFVTF